MSARGIVKHKMGYTRGDKVLIDQVKVGIVLKGIWVSIGWVYCLNTGASGIECGVREGRLKKI